MLPQSRTELMLKELLEKKGGKVEMGTEVEKIGFKSGRAVVKTNKDEQAYDVVFAADGAKSTIRKALNIPFEGTTLDREIYLSDY
jgi:2-polyprenyl-6-methoxyphenol hydroxylase-like FAD-dependent oxidoreductase